MAATKATKEQVFNACNLLVSQNKKVTVDAVLRLTGGSKSTVAPFVKEWRKENPEAGYNPNNFIPMPEEVKEALIKTWMLAMLEAEQITNNDINAYLEAENQQLKIQIEDMEKKLMGYEEMKGRTGALEEQVKWLTTKNAELAEQLGQLKRSFEHMQPTLQSTNGHAITGDWEYDVNPSDD